MGSQLPDMNEIIDRVGWTAGEIVAREPQWIEAPQTQITMVRSTADSQSPEVTITYAEPRKGKNHVGSNS